MINYLMSRIQDSQEDLDKIQEIRNKYIAHLDKDFQKYNLSVPLEMGEKLFRLAYEIFNKLNQELRGKTLGIEHIESNTLTTLLPIKIFYELKKN